MKIEINLPEVLYRRKRSKSLNDISDPFQLQADVSNDNCMSTNLLWCVHEGNKDAVERYYEHSFDMGSCDYDKRTPLHIAAATGHADIVEYLVEVCQVDKYAKDRWGYTAFDEAKRFGHTEIVSLLTETSGQHRCPCEDTDDDSILSIGNLTKEDTNKLQEETVSRLLYRAKEGNLQEIKRFYEAGVDMDLYDYDERTALHVAAAEGHLHIVKFLWEECNVNLNAKDRWNHLPIYEAKKFGHTHVEAYLETCAKQVDNEEHKPSYSEKSPAELQSDNSQLEDSQHETFTKEVDVKEVTKTLPYDLRVVLTSDNTTFAALLKNKMADVKVELLNELTEHLHIVITFHTIYLFIFDLTKPITQQLNECHSINYFLALAAHKTHGDTRVILVGLNKEKLEGHPADIDEQVDDFFEQVRQEFDETPGHKYIFQHFAINTETNSQEEDEELVNLIRNIHENRQSEEIVSKYLPLKEELKNCNEKVITIEDIWQIINETNVEIHSNQELYTFLETLTKAGFLIFHNKIETNNYVILDRQWFIDAAMSIINLNKFHRTNPHLRQSIQRLLKIGVLEKSLLEVVWSCEREKTFWENKDALLLYLASYHLVESIMWDEHNTALTHSHSKWPCPVPSSIHNGWSWEQGTAILNARGLRHLEPSCAQPSIDSIHSNGIERQDILLIPGILSHFSILNNEDIYHKFKNEFKSLPLVYVNKLNYFPPILFNKIISVLLGKFQVYQCLNQTLLFSDAGAFHIGPDLVGIIRLLHTAVELRVVNMSDDLPDAKICKNFNDIVKTVIDNHMQECEYSCSDSCDFRPAIGCQYGHCWIDLETLNFHSKLRCHDLSRKHSHDKITVEKQWFSESSCQVVVEDKDIAQLVYHAIGSQWQYLGELLGLQGISFRDSENSSMCTSHKIFNMLKRWRDESSETATWEELYNKMKMTCSIDLEPVHQLYNGFTY